MSTKSTRRTNSCCFHSRQLLEKLAQMTSPRQKRQRQRDSSTNGDSSRVKLADQIETANKKTDAEFIDEYLQPSQGWTQWTHPSTGVRYTLSFANVAQLSETELDECFHLIEETSGEAYRTSSVGWHPALKKKEMRSPDLRYILVKIEDGEKGEGSLHAFTSFMPTYEFGDPVVYCYEIHMRPELRGTGFGRQLMGHVLTAAEHIPSVVKVMLTCFVSNEAGRRFYDKLGFEKDPFSPRDRKLRGGKVLTSDYVILSRRITGRNRRTTEGP